MEFYNNGDASGVADLHMDDALVMPPNIDMVKGRFRTLWDKDRDRRLQRVYKIIDTSRPN